MTKYRIPVRVVRPTVESRPVYGPENVPHPAPTAEPSAGLEIKSRQIEEAATDAASSADVSPGTGAGLQGSAETRVSARTYRSSEEQDWRELALRLRADMENYRRRQQQLAEAEARAEQGELLKDILGIADNLERALDAAQGQRVDKQSGRGFAQDLYQGVELTSSALQRVLRKHGLERITADGAPFDPAWHQALHVVPASTLGVEPNTVVEVVEAGYLWQGRLFRPAKVVVAQ